MITTDNAWLLWALRRVFCPLRREMTCESFLTWCFTFCMCRVTFFACVLHGMTAQWSSEVSALLSPLLLVILVCRCETGVTGLPWSVSPAWEMFQNDELFRPCCQGLSAVLTYLSSHASGQSHSWKSTSPLHPRLPKSWTLSIEYC